MKKVDKSSSAGTPVDSSTNVDVSSVSQPIAKPNVVRSPLLGDDIFNFQEQFISKLLNDINSKKDALIKQKLEEKGYGHLINGIEKRRFPKICCERKGNWSYYFADNDTDEGDFIVAIEEYSVKNDLSVERGVNMTMTFNWQDTFPG